MYVDFFCSNEIAAIYCIHYKQIIVRHTHILIFYFKPLTGLTLFSQTFHTHFK